MKNRIFIGEFIGSAFLVMIIVGSGIMAQNLTRDFAVMLLANTIATGAGLFVLINSSLDKFLTSFKSSIKYDDSDVKNNNKKMTKRK